VDIMPSICEFMKVEIPAEIKRGLDGESFYWTRRDLYLKAIDTFISNFDVKLSDWTI
jgi:hypothetical protein